MFRASGLGDHSFGEGYSPFNLTVNHNGGYKPSQPIQRGEWHHVTKCPVRLCAVPEGHETFNRRWTDLNGS